MRTVVLSLAIFLVSYAVGAQGLGSNVLAGTKKLSIHGVPPDPAMVMITGTAWSIFLSWSIDSEAGKRLERYLKKNRVPGQSIVHLNSHGGSLIGGLALGRVLRNYEMSTYVGSPPSNGERFSSKPGVCYSACAMAFLGGRFRFGSLDASRFGVHRFSFQDSKESDVDLAQITSAIIVNYIKEMGVRTELFEVMTRAGKNEIYELKTTELSRLNIINNGAGETTWEIKSVEDGLYLKGERDTVYGINKFITYCHQSGVVMLHVIFDPQRRSDEILVFPSHRLVVDKHNFDLTPISKNLTNGWLNFTYPLSPKHVASMKHAKRVGLMVRLSPSAGVFFGFDNLPFTGGASLFRGLLKNSVC